jgi:protoporphyrinogen IX oxidase
VSLAGLYPWLKALHVASAIIFAGGVLAVSVLLAAAPAGTGSSPLAGAVRRWDQTVTMPAMLLVWAFGLALASTGHWFSDLWLQAKLVLVVVLSGIHGLQSGRLRRLAGGAAVRPWRPAPLVLACIVAIAVLAVIKP